MKLETGKNYLVLTVTHYWVGRLVSVDGPHTVTLADASWVAQTGRFHEFVAKGRAPNMEVEPVDFVSAHYVSILPWPHKLFREAYQRDDPCSEKGD